ARAGRGSNAGYGSAPPTGMPAGPWPPRSNAIAVPSRDVTDGMTFSFRLRPPGRWRRGQSVPWPPGTGRRPRGALPSEDDGQGKVPQDRHRQREREYVEEVSATRRLRPDLPVRGATR